VFLNSPVYQTLDSLALEELRLISRVKIFSSHEAILLIY
jgi:hypothetical protein